MTAGSAITVVISSAPGREAYIIDLLYAVAAQVEVDALALVVLENGDETEAAALSALLEPVRPLVEVTLLKLAADSAQGPWPAFNHGLRHVTTPFCAFLEDTDVPYPRFGGVLTRLLQEDEKASMAYGNGYAAWGRLAGGSYITETKKRWLAPAPDRAQLACEVLIPLGAAAFRTSALIDTGAEFEEPAGRLAGWLFVRQVATRGRFIAVDEPVFEHRLERPPAPLEAPHTPDPGWVAADSNRQLQLAAEMVGVTTAELASRYRAHREIGEGAEDVEASPAEEMTLTLPPLERGGQEDAPAVTVSIIILVYSRDNLALRCLESLARNVPGDIGHEVILLANGLGLDALAPVQQQFPEARLVLSPVNLGFAGGCNRAARAARGQYLALLNDDAEVQSGWLEALLETASAYPKVGAVGSRIVLADGSLQEAGSVVWSDASTIGVGRDLPPGSTDYTYVREVDYCSAASLLVRKDLWDEIGGMDEDFHPAYGEDVDLAFEIKRRGYRVLYEPRSCIRHAETASTDEHFRTFMIVRNRHRLLDKWSEELAEREPPPDPEGREAAIRRAIFRARGFPRRLLVIDDRYPEYSLGSGFGRMLSTVEELSRFAAVSFFPSAGHSGDPSHLQRLGVEIITEPLEAHVSRPDVIYDAVLISRPHNWDWYFEPLRRCQPVAPIIYDAEAIFYRRLDLMAAVTYDPAVAEEAVKMRRLEERISLEADFLVCVSQEEADVMAAAGGRAPIRVIEPRAIKAELTPAGFRDRSDVLVVGGWLHGPTAPNSDGFHWFASSVLPVIRENIPWVRVNVTGGNPPPNVSEHAGPSVRLLGQVPDLRAVYGEARVAVVPLRYGSGVKIKTVEALLHGVPVVATTVGAQGIDLGGLPAIEVTDDAADFASRVVRLLGDPATWARQRQAVERLLRRWKAEPALSWVETVGEVLDGKDRILALRG